VTTSTVRGPYRMALRIYVVTVAAVLATAAALFLVVALARERSESPIHAMFREIARYAAARVAERWPAEAEMRSELAALSQGLQVRAAVYRWDGAPVAGVDHSFAPLTAAERDVLARDGIVERSGTGGPRRLAHLALPIAPAGEPVGYVVLVPPPPPQPIPGVPPELLALALVLIGVGVAAVVLGGSIARPLDRLARTAHALGAGDLSARTGVTARGDEVGAVAHAFDDMADRLVALLRGQTELIANVAHELRTPLARIRVALDLAAEGDAKVARESLAEIEEDLAELEALVNDVLTSARMDLAANRASGGAPPVHLAPLEVAAVVTQAAGRMRQRHPGRAVELELAADIPPVTGDAVLLRRALENLLDNARKYSPPDTEIRVRASRQGDEAVVEVIDRGEGIAPEDLDRLFTPFFRADRSRARATGGVGLGLALARRIVEAHGGTLVARSAPGAGTTMTIALPVHASARPG